jgi:hypothetical protein
MDFRSNYGEEVQSASFEFEDRLQTDKCSHVYSFSVRSLSPVLSASVRI